MFLNCGVFQKTKSGRDNKSEGSVTMSPTSQKRSLLNSKDGSVKEMSSQECLIEKKSHLCTNNWAQLEGVFYKDFSGENGPEKMYHFLQCLSEMLTSYIISESDRSAKVLDFHHPHQLKEMMSHCLDVHSEPRDLEQVLSDVRETLKYCVKTGHPHFLNQLSTGIDVVGVAGAWTASAANTNLLCDLRADDVKVISFCRPRLTRVSCGQQNDQPPLLSPTNVSYPIEMGGLRSA